MKNFGFIQWATRTHGWHIDQLKDGKIRVFLGETSGCDVENRLEERFFKYVGGRSDKIW